MKKTPFLIIMLGLLLTGCTANTESNTAVEETASIVSKYGQETNDDYLIITEKMEEMGISGNFEEGKATEDIDIVAGLRNRNADYYVMATSTDGNIYYGIVEDGVVDVWSSDDDRIPVPEGEEISGNVLLKLESESEFDGAVEITLMDIMSSDSDNADDYITYDVTLSQDNAYKVDLSLQNGTYVVYDYDIESTDGQYYLIDAMFEVNNDQQMIIMRVGSFDE